MKKLVRDIRLAAVNRITINKRTIILIIPGHFFLSFIVAINTIRAITVVDDLDQEVVKPMKVLEVPSLGLQVQMAWESPHVRSVQKVLHMKVIIKKETEITEVLQLSAQVSLIKYEKHHPRQYRNIRYDFI